MRLLDGRVAIITGGGRGIGASIARRFADEGAAVVINDLGTSPDGVGVDLGPAEAVATEIRERGGKAVADGGDIADAATGQRLVDTAIASFGKLDILVNVAGILRDRMIFNMTEDDWDSVIRVHLRGHFSTVKPVSQYFREQRNPQGGYRIINFTSISALDGSPGQANYAAAKMGVIGLTYSLAQGLARYGVTANAISPGASTRLTSTVATERAHAASDESPERSPDNIAPLAVYLASERSGWLTGRTLKAAGYGVGLYNNPEIVRQVNSAVPWDMDRLAEMLEEHVRPIADGLPPSIFTEQRARN